MKINDKYMIYGLISMYIIILVLALILHKITS